jgi:formylglycine-generating enzyme
VTVGQYCQFLNAVARTDTYGLYGWWLAQDYSTIKITKSGSSGSYSYSVSGSCSQAANCPIFAVPWGSAARFCNWLQNGQPTGAEGPGTTETGAYILNGATTTSALMQITRDAGAKYFIPSEDEWYKAAYYKGGNTASGYWAYPTRNDSSPSNVFSATGTNNANYWNNRATDPTNGLTPVGAFAASPSPYGAYDMGGDVWQWNEALLDSSRGTRGGGWFGYEHDNNYYLLAASHRRSCDPADPAAIVGFRVASLAVPEPGSLAVLLAGAIGLLTYARRRRKGATDWN